MAMDYFIGYSMEDKLALLRGLTESMMTGQIVAVTTSRDSKTEFSPNVSNELTYERLCYAIINDDGFNPNDPMQAGCLKNQRVSSTRILHNCD